MGLRTGILGLPNVGKSTLFNAITAQQVDAQNYPFCTIEPNVGTVAVPDKRMKDLAGIVNTKILVPATLEIVDIAGLVRGASKGEGLGNKFLSHLREVDALIHVVRCFEDSNVVHVDGSVNPKRDIETIETELIFSDLDSLEKRIPKLEKDAKKDSKLQPQVDFMKRVYELLNTGKPARLAAQNDDEKAMLKSLFLLTSKPVLYAANVNENDVVSGNSFTNEVEAIAAIEGAKVVVVCAKIESEIAMLPEEEKPEFLASLGLEMSGLDRVIRAAYDLLGLQTYFTAGEKEVHAWTIRKGAKAPEAAGVIHTDFEKGFIRAEVMKYQDLVQFGNEQKVKEAGKLSIEGKEYVVNDGDVMLFRFNV
ncbi:MAG: redox-regulated ATPase YchF [Chloroherpetonaceae bacterium]|nr:redox-regulated ATPase YchF [Chloroherpetonaceae bacterium]